MSAAAVTVLGAALAYALLRQGGVWAEDWAACLVAMGSLGAVYGVWARSRAGPALRGAAAWLLTGFCALAVLQVVPLPVGWVEWVSPARGELARAAARVAGETGWATLSAAPALTWEHLMRLGGYVVVFLVMRDVAWRAEASSEGAGAWMGVMPLVVLGVLEAGLGLVQSYGGGTDGIARGTFVNRNHFAGFLEMSLALAVALGAALYRRGGRVWGACGVLAGAGVMLAAVLQSQSRMGFLAALGGLLLMGALALGARRQGWRRWAPMVGLGAVMAGAFVMLPGDELIGRYAKLASAEAVTTDMRAQIWGDTARMIKEYRVGGVRVGRV